MMIFSNKTVHRYLHKHSCVYKDFFSLQYADQYVWICMTKFVSSHEDLSWWGGENM